MDPLDTLRLIRVVLDANVFVSGFTNENGPPAQIIRRWIERSFHVIVSEHILREVTLAWTQSYFQTRYTADEARAAIDLIRQRTTLVVPDLAVRGVATHRHDDTVLGTARAGAADFLVTGDNELRGLNLFGKTTLVTPREFLDRLEESGI